MSKYEKPPLDFGGLKTVPLAERGGKVKTAFDRPHAQSGGKGYAITGHHELMIPLLAAALIERG